MRLTTSSCRLGGIISARMKRWPLSGSTVGCVIGLPAFADGPVWCRKRSRWSTPPSHCLPPTTSIEQRQNSPCHCLLNTLRHRRSETDFTRHRTLPFPVVLLFLLNLVKGALQRELDDFFQVLHGTDVAERAVTKSALCAARQKRKPSAVSDLNRHLVRRWGHEVAVRRWHGLDVRAIDGSTLRLPDTPSPRSVRWSPPTALRRPWRGSPSSTIHSTASFSTP